MSSSDEECDLETERRATPKGDDDDEEEDGNEDVDDDNEKGATPCSRTRSSNRKNIKKK